ncbi:MAG: DUF5647 family protein [Chloroflexota bacterium]
MDALDPKVVADKVFELMEQFNHYVFAHPDILDGLPERAVLVLLDPEDEEFNRANIEMVKSSPKPPQDAPIVYVRMTKQVRVVQQVEWKPSIVSSPLAA